MKINIDNESIKWLDENGTVIADYRADRDVPFLVYDGGKKEMTNEQIRNEINEATRDFRETTRKVNEALNHAAGRLNKCEQEAYDRGLNDCWEMVKKIREMSWKERVTALDLMYSQTDGLEITLLNIDNPQQALAKIRAWEEKKTEEERKKQEEAEKIQIGDVVEVTIRNCTGVPPTYRGVVISDTEHSLLFIRKNGQTDCVVKDSTVTIKKTGEHVDILGALKK